MSTILKALRRLEEEREAEGRDLRDQVLARPRRTAEPRPRFGLLVGAGAIGAVLVVGGFLALDGRLGAGGAPAPTAERPAAPAPVATARTASEPRAPARTMTREPIAPTRHEPIAPTPRAPASVARTREAPAVARVREAAAPEPSARVARLAPTPAPRTAPEPTVRVAPEPTVRVAPEPATRVAPTPAPRVVPEPSSAPAVAAAPPAVEPVAVAVDTTTEPAAAELEEAVRTMPGIVGEPEVARRARLPHMVLERTLWHPSRDRRLAFLRVEGREGLVRLREGDAVGDVVVQQIDPSAVVLLHRGVEIRRRIGAGG